jgi:hypothetical protein
MIGHGWIGHAGESYSPHASMMKHTDEMIQAAVIGKGIAFSSITLRKGAVVKCEPAIPVIAPGLDRWGREWRRDNQRDVVFQPCCRILPPEGAKMGNHRIRNVPQLFRRHLHAGPRGFRDPRVIPEREGDSGRADAKLLRNVT